jgi:hypothetical protein
MRGSVVARLVAACVFHTSGSNLSRALTRHLASPSKKTAPFDSLIRRARQETWWI